MRLAFFRLFSFQLDIIYRKLFNRRLFQIKDWTFIIVKSRNKTTVSKVQKLNKIRTFITFTYGTGYLTTDWQVKMPWHAMGIHVTQKFLK